MQNHTLVRWATIWFASCWLQLDDIFRYNARVDLNPSRQPLRKAKIESRQQLQAVFSQKYVQRNALEKAHFEIGKPNDIRM